MRFVCLFSRTGRRLFLVTPAARAPMYCTRLLHLSTTSTPSPPTPLVSSAAPQEQRSQQPPHGGELGELLARLNDQLERVTGKSAVIEGTIQQQVAQVSLMQRQQAVLERRIVALEEEAARTQQQIAESTRIASDVSLQHHNVDALVRQMEKLVLKALSPSISENGNGSSNSLSADEDHTTESGGVNLSVGERQPGAPSVASDVHAGSLTPLHVTISSSSPSHPPSTVISDIGRRVSVLSTRLEALQARMEQLTAEKLVTNVVQPHLKSAKVDVASAAVSRAASKAVKDAGVNGNESAGSPVSAKSLSALLRNTGAFPFKDNAGVTRIGSQKVVVRGIPVNVGASEVRDMFSRVGPVLSCVLRPASVASGETSLRGARYRSQQHEEEEGDKEQTSKQESSTSCTSVLGKRERTFEVTFLAVEHAVRAVLELDGYQLQGDCVLSVVPSVSVDILTAVQELERESEKK
ncbi:hypothetical protein, conserved [Trypanosoma brucei gambiense DAL972]|uniref:RNA-binding protein n=1 Tax=Trypanosoma brucei gambiense (strain MHOM/CI/86/DAL972) TaxID=679716 RepID=C9ZP32_TRYB9|nr:hypothetical protein, conserved [Trypanosoma brucei gambiense DAL972]CBH11160.1 hypothetical protein, conserved [Trypanosoma brucei gambiense DAL972]|eukprot:XP_011773447.1 hypothetical protein, conserved [Trypanosoma brucei gambiense DAL972]